MRKAVNVLVLSLLVLSLTGCSQEKMPEISSLSFDKEGAVLHQIVGKADQNYYQIQMSDLESFAAERVEEYCSDKGEGRVTLEAVEEKSGNILLQFRYASLEDYSGFNHRVLYIGSLEDAVDEYYLESVPFVSVEGQASEIGYMDGWDAKKMLVLETKGGEDILVNLPGKTLYINQSADSSQEVAFVGKKSVKVSNQEETEASALSYIIYE